MWDLNHINIVFSLKSKCNNGYNNVFPPEMVNFHKFVLKNKVVFMLTIIWDQLKVRHLRPDLSPDLKAESNENTSLPTVNLLVCVKTFPQGLED